MGKRMINAGIELAIGIGSGAAFAEEQIALGVGHPGIQKARECATAGSDLTSSLDQVDRHAAFCEHQRGEQTGGPGPHDRNALWMRGNISSGNRQVLRRRERLDSAGAR